MTFGTAILYTPVIIFAWFATSLLIYLNHRFVFHREPSSAVLRALLGPWRNIHLSHHRAFESTSRADDLKRSGAFPSFVLVLVLAIAVLLSPFSSPFLLFSFLGVYLALNNYETEHIGKHTKSAVTPGSLTYKTDHHVYHHHNSNCNYGISPFWDKIFKTYKEPSYEN